MDTSTGIDFGDMQGLVRFAHGRLTESAFILLRIRNRAAAGEWLATAQVTAATVLEEPPSAALQLAFTAHGLLAMGLSESIVSAFSPEFISGMSGDKNRSRRLGDTGTNAPEHWAWGGADANVDLLLILYSGTGGIDEQLTRLHNEPFDNAFDSLETLVSKSVGPEEPFGFADGISQPEIDWRQAASTDTHQRATYSNLLAPGEIVLGYRNEYGLYTARPLLNPAQTEDIGHLPPAADRPALKDLGRNGSYLVLRQLSQDVGGFWSHLDEQANGDTARREQLAAAMVGRQRDGTPLVGRSTHPIPGISPGQANNDFSFDDDPLGRQCPIGSHVRRANPRTGDLPPGVSGLLQRLLRTLGFGRRHPGEDLIASTRFHRILRRGRAYGSQLDPEQALSDESAEGVSQERGLIFVCLGANLSRQFEFVQGAWMASSKFAGLPTESDPLLGNRQPLLDGTATDSFSRPQAGAPAHITQSLPQFVTVRGGAYFFMPGLRALDFIVQRARS